ncbi:hypothetical protein HDZ31DRAFT_74988 [Schizophyllum fasciatum]
MSLDKNLFTLHFIPNPDAPNVTDLVDPAGTIHYRKQRVPGAAYAVEVYDPMSESLLVKVSAPASTSKTKVLELCNPTSVVELKYTGTLSFRWSFKWEEHEFEWKREECYLLRKPDPPVLVAVTKEPAGRLKTRTVQILDYNINRFDVDDRKGLEIVILTALLTFQDANDAYHTPTSTRQSSGPSPAVATNEPSAPPPPPPPRPEPKSGVDRIAELQAIRGELNEVTVEDEGDFKDYAQYSANLLADDAMLFITVRSSDAQHVPKVLQVVEETKRIRHKAGIYDEDELHQYVVYDAVKSKGPRRINLDDDSDGRTKYTPPNSLSVHLSKIPMPELQPKLSVKDKDDSKRRSAPPPLPSSSSEDRAKNSKLRRPRSKSPPRQSKAQTPPKHPPRVHSHQVHPHQPSPSPSQLNNPHLYNAPPPPPPGPRTSFYGSFMSRPPPPPSPSQGQQQSQQQGLSGVMSGLLGAMRR